MPEVPWAWSRPGRTAVLGSQVGLVALVVVAVGAGPLSPLVQARLSWLASVACNLGTLLAAQHIARRLRPGDPARRFWWAISAASVMIGGAFLAQLTTVGGAADLRPVPANVALVGLGVTVVVAVMCTYPLRIESSRERLCFWLDMATVMVGAGAFGWYFSEQSSGDLSSDLMGILGGPVVNLVAVFAVARLLLVGRPPFSAWTGVLGAAAAAVGGLAGAVGPTLLADGRGSWLFALSALGDGLIMIAAWFQRLQVDADPRALERPRRRPYSMLPYVALVATFTLMAAALADRGLDGRTWAVLAGAGISTGLVVARQLASFTDNARLLGELDAKVRELHETETVLRAALQERDQLATRLRELAFQDSLTGLANRALFYDRLGEALLRARRHRRQVVVMLLDLDDFKPINDRFGHAAGDAVLKEVARRLRGCVRETDTVARIGGDEFAVLLDDPLSSGVDAVAERIAAAVREPCWVDGERMAVGVSIGVASNQSGDADTDRLLGEADAAMYAAKSSGKGGRRQHRLDAGTAGGYVRTS